MNNMDRKIENIAMFVAGNPEENSPQKVFFSYDVTTKRGSKRNSIHTVEELEAGKPAEDVWSEEVAKIKESEGITS
jgi:hypothetical protein